MFSFLFVYLTIMTSPKNGLELGKIVIGLRYCSTSETTPLLKNTPPPLPLRLGGWSVSQKLDHHIELKIGYPEVLEGEPDERQAFHRGADTLCAPADRGRRVGYGDLPQAPGHGTEFLPLETDDVPVTLPE